MKDFKMKGWTTTTIGGDVESATKPFTIRIEKSLLQDMDMYLAKIQLSGLKGAPKTRSQLVNLLIKEELKNGCILQSGVQGQDI